MSATLASTIRSAVGATPTLSSVRQNCRKVICIGRNYAEHITELNNAAPKKPFWFLKPPSSILLPGEGRVQIPRGVSVHYEVELGLVLKERVRNLEERDGDRWRDVIGQYLLAIDMTARNVQDEAKKKGLPWDVAKGFDTFLPLAGPVSTSIIKDPHDVELWLDVNGESRQRDSTGLMLFRINRQLAEISKVMTLEPGDIVLTGTPKGVGRIQTGDTVTAGIRVDGRDIEEARMEIGVEDKPGPYVYSEV